MRDRISMIMERENLSPTKFAEVLKIQPSNISHLLSGRNKPSFDLLMKIIAVFPHISGDWLLSGQGEYRKVTSVNSQDDVKSLKSHVPTSLFDQIPQVIEKESPTVRINAPSALNEPEKSLELPFKDLLKPSKSVSVKRIMLIYSDNTFEELTPRIDS